MDSIKTANHGLLILGAINPPRHLDTVFRRPGRFQRIIFVPLSDEAVRKSIVDIKTKGKPMDSAKVAKVTKDFSGAHLLTILTPSVFHLYSESLAFNGL